jgi:hypothetical protein
MFDYFQSVPTSKDGFFSGRGQFDGKKLLIIHAFKKESFSCEEMPLYHSECISFYGTVLYALSFLVHCKFILVVHT